MKTTPHTTLIIPNYVTSGDIPKIWHFFDYFNIAKVKDIEYYNNNENSQLDQYYGYGYVIILIDECFTFDSSRFWYLDNYNYCFKNNLEPKSIDKDIIRKYINSNCNPYKDDIPNSPENIKLDTFNTYLNLYNLLIN